MAEEINFDDLQREISAAEDYLRSRPQTTVRASYAAPTSSSATPSDKNLSSSSDGVLHRAAWGNSNQVKAFVAATTNNTSAVAQPDTPGTPDSLAYDNNSGNKYRYSDAAASTEMQLQQLHEANCGDGVIGASHEWEQGDQAAAVETSYSDIYTRQALAARDENAGAADAEAAAAASQEGGPGRYASEASREELISRLLAEHGSRALSASGATAGSSSAAAAQHQRQEQQPFVVGGQYAGGSASANVSETLGSNSRNEATIENYSRAYEEQVSGAEAGAGAGGDVATDFPARGEGSEGGDTFSVSNSSPPNSPPHHNAALADTLFYASDLHEGPGDDVHPGMADFNGSLLHGVMSSGGGDHRMEHSEFGEAVGAASLGHTFDGENDLAATLNRNVRLSGNLVQASSLAHAHTHAEEEDPYSIDDAPTGDDEGDYIHSNSIDNVEGEFKPDGQFPPLSQAWVIDANEGSCRKNGNSNGSGEDNEVYARARAASGIPSRLKENQKKNWRFVKSREDCLKEGEEKLRKEYTFQPKLITRERKHREITPSTPGGSRPTSDTSGTHKVASNSSRGNPNTHSRIRDSVRIHENTLKTREKLKEHVENLEANACTFKPQISKMATKIMQKKEAKDRQDSSAARGYDGYVDPYASVADVPVHSQKAKHQQIASERLYGRAKIKAEQQEFLGQQVQKERDALCTFQPTINSNTKAMYDNMEKRFGMQHVPIHERVADLQKYKSKRLHDLRAAIEEVDEEAMPFAPAIDSKSRRMVQRQRSEHGVQANLTREDSHGNVQDMDIADRLLQEAKAVQFRKQQLTQKLEKEQLERNTPLGPSQGSSNLARSNHFVGASFAQRQQMYENMLARKDQDRQKRECEASAEWFKPNIGKSREIIAASRPQQVVESSNERTERLYRTDNEVKEYRRKAREVEMYGQDKYQPTIDPLSKHLGQASSLDELVENTKGRNVREAARKRVEAEHGKECTFQPKITEYAPDGHLLGDEYQDGLYSWQGQMSQSVMSTRSAATATSAVASKQSINMHEPEKMAQQIRAGMVAKEEKRRQELMHREIDELKDCTFAPKINPAPSKKHSMALISDDGSYAGGAGDETPVIRGLGRYLELKVMTIKKAEEREEREKDVFSVRNAEIYRRPEDGATVVQPFSLSARDLRPSRAIESMRAEEEAELTFLPDTELSQRRESIRSQARATGLGAY